MSPQEQKLQQLPLVNALDTGPQGFDIPSLLAQYVENTPRAAVTAGRSDVHDACTIVEIFAAICDELAEQKQDQDVIFPPSPQPRFISRTIVLKGTSAQGGNCLYAGIRSMKTR